MYTMNAMVRMQNKMLKPSIKYIVAYLVQAFAAQRRNLYNPMRGERLRYVYNIERPAQRQGLFTIVYSIRTQLIKTEAPLFSAMHDEVIATQHPGAMMTGNYNKRMIEGFPRHVNPCFYYDLPEMGVMPDDFKGYTKLSPKKIPLFDFDQAETFFPGVTIADGNEEKEKVEEPIVYVVVERGADGALYLRHLKDGETVEEDSAWKETYFLFKDASSVPETSSVPDAKRMRV
jgi:hypothetical protein